MHVIDASRVVGVVSNLLDPGAQGRARRREPRRLRRRLRALHAERERTPLLPYRKALEHRTPIEWRAEDVAPPPFTGARVVEPSLDELRDAHRLDVLLHRVGAEGPLPADPRPPEARGGGTGAVRERQRAARRDRGRGRAVQARGVYGFWPAHAEGDDIVLADGMVFPMLRQQVTTAQGDDRPNRSLADFVAPGRERPRRPPRRLRGHGRPRAPTSSPRRSRPTSTTTARSW